MDKKNEKLLTLLQENSRESLKALGSKIGLSIDSTKKRIEKLKNLGIITKFGVSLNPKAMGYDIVANNKIKLTNISKIERERFINYLVNHPSCIELISVSGDYDWTCVLIAKNTDYFNDLVYEIREKFKDIISDWNTSFNLKIYKFEEYDLKTS